MAGIHDRTIPPQRRCFSLHMWQAERQEWQEVTECAPYVPTPNFQTQKRSHNGVSRPPSSRRCEKYKRTTSLPAHSLLQGRNQYKQKSETTVPLLLTGGIGGQCGAGRQWCTGQVAVYRRAVATPGWERNQLAGQENGHGSDNQLRHELHLSTQSKGQGDRHRIKIDRINAASSETASPAAREYTIIAPPAPLPPSPSHD